MKFHRGQKDILAFLASYGGPSAWKTVRRWASSRRFPLQYDDTGKPVLYEDDYFAWQRDRTEPVAVEML